MKYLPFLTAALCALPLSGCVTFTEQEFAEVRAHHISPVTYRKIRERQVLTLEDVIELSQAGVPETLIVKEIDTIGVDYALTHRDLLRLARMGVSQAIVDALYAATDRFVTRYAPPSYFETHNLDSGEYVNAPPLHYSSTLLRDAQVGHR